MHLSREKFCVSFTFLYILQNELIFQLAGSKDESLIVFKMFQKSFYTENVSDRVSMISNAGVEI